MKITLAVVLLLLSVPSRASAQAAPGPIPGKEAAPEQAPTLTVKGHGLGESVAYFKALEPKATLCEYDYNGNTKIVPSSGRIAFEFPNSYRGTSKAVFENEKLIYLSLAIILILLSRPL